MDAINKAAEKAGIDPSVVKQVVTAENRPTSDFDRLLSAGEKLLRHQQNRLITVESDYQAARLGILDGCRVGMEKLKIEAENDLRELDRRHHKNVVEIEATIMALRGLKRA